MLQYFAILLVLLVPVCLSSNTRLDNSYVDPPPLIHTPHFDLIIVFNGYINTKRDHWLEILKNQMEDLNCNGLAHRAKELYISLSMDEAGQYDKISAGVANQTISALREIQPKAIFDLTLENRYEYPGMRTMWDISQRLSPERADKTIFAYFHSKGMFETHTDNFHGANTPEQIKMSHATFDRWDIVLDKFHKYPELNKAGIYPARFGWIWLNFFYVRATYVQKLVNPTITTDRFYYESWLSNIDRDRTWPKVHHIEFSEHNVVNFTDAQRPNCSDCWSVLPGEQFANLGLTFEVMTIPWHRMDSIPFYKCRHVKQSAPAFQLKL